MIVFLSDSLTDQEAAASSSTENDTTIDFELFPADESNVVLEEEVYVENVEEVVSQIKLEEVVDPVCVNIETEIISMDTTIEEDFKTTEQVIEVVKIEDVPVETEVIPKVETNFEQQLDVLREDLSTCDINEPEVKKEQNELSTMQVIHKTEVIQSVKIEEKPTVEAVELKSEVSMEIETTNDDIMDDDEEEQISTVRRSRRLKSIVDTTVRQRIPMPSPPPLSRNLPPTSLTEETCIQSPLNSPSSNIIAMSSSFCSSPELKVKTRWRKCAEMELLFETGGTENIMSAPQIDNSIPPPLNQNSDVIPSTLDIMENVDLCDERLSRFITIRDNLYLSERVICKINKTMKCDCTISEEEVKKGEVGCTVNCINRMLYIECSLKCRCGEYCDNQQFQRYNYVNCGVFRTERKGFGIRANHEVFPDQFIIEYVGEVLNTKQFEKRAKQYSKDKNRHYYFMALRSSAVIDATTKGNISRFINHSCDPNAMTQKWTVNGELRVGFFSTRYIKPGEEITFDYQFQRYGKQAQKCYCEADNCRGWIGENPISDEESGDDGKSKKIKGKKTKVSKKSKAKLVAEDIKLEDEVDEVDDDEDEEMLANEIKIPIKKRESIRKYASKLKKRQEMFDDLEIQGEIMALLESGLKNCHHTLKLSRLVVRAKNVEPRSRLLGILVNGDLPCRRLFLDYNGLKLLYNWMCDINVKNSVPELNFCIELMEAFDLLPITNKTVLRDSKVLDRVEKWSNLDLEEKKKKSKEEKKLAKADKKKNKEDAAAANEAVKTTVVPIPIAPSATEIDDLIKQGSAFVSEMSVDQLKEIVDSCDKMKAQDVLEVEAAIVVEEPPASSYDVIDELTFLKLRVKEVAAQLLKKWEVLKEDFKIPKKRKLEQMIEHEREADSTLLDDEVKNVPSDRYKSRGEIVEASSRSVSSKKNFDSGMSKQERRQIFEMKMAQIDAEKRYQEMGQIHQQNCLIFGLNAQHTSPLDVPFRVNLVTGQYFTFDGRYVPQPPNHALFQLKQPLLTTNPVDYLLPPIDLPEHWKYGIDNGGRIYYYHIKIREPQWEPPIKILPLVESEDDEGISNDESTTDTEDSEEEELLQTLKMLQRKRQLLSAQSSKSNIVDAVEGRAGEVLLDEDELEQKILNNMLINPLIVEQASPSPMLLSMVVDPRKKKKKSRRGLATMKFIRPRTEEDKLYGKAEMRRYREVKEKLRRNKKRRLMMDAAGIPPNLDDEDDDSFVNDSSADLDDSLASSSDSLTCSMVDELDILSKIPPTKQLEKIKKIKKDVDVMKSYEKRRSGLQGSSFTEQAPIIKKKTKMEMPPHMQIDYNELKHQFRDEIKSEVAKFLLPYFDENCNAGRISCQTHYEHLIHKVPFLYFIQTIIYLIIIFLFLSLHIQLW